MREKPLILIVDDERDLREIVSIKLDCLRFRYGARRQCGGRHRKAEETASRTRSSMDIHMPGESGTDAALDDQAKYGYERHQNRVPQQYQRSVASNNRAAQQSRESDRHGRFHRQDRRSECYDCESSRNISAAITKTPSFSRSRVFCYSIVSLMRIFLGFGSTLAARRDLNFSTRPAMSMSFSSPV